MAKNEAKIKFNAEVSEFNDSIGKANREMAELRAEMKLNETQMKGTGESAEGLQKKHDILENQLKASEAKTEALNQKVKKAEEIFGETSQEASKLRVQLLNAQNAEEKLRQAVNGCNDEIGKSDEVADEAADGFTVMKGAMADLVADGIEAVAGGLADVAKESFGMANDIDSATDTFIAKTGESTKSAGEFEDAMVDIYNGNYGESFEDISGSMATIKQVMGDIGTDELENLTQKSLVLRDTFDFEVNESIRGANSMIDQFGITADEAYNLIAQGAQNGLNQNDDLLDVVNEYSVQFADAGFNAEEMFNMLANGAESGTWSVDKLGDAVKEYNIRVSDGTVAEALEENRKKLGFTADEVKKLTKAYGQGGDAGKKAMQETLDAVMSVDDETERYKLGVELFGTMWEDLGEDAVVALFDTKGEISSTKKALDEIDAVKYDNLGSALEGVKRNLQTSIAEPMKENVMPAVNEFIEDVDWQGTGQIIGEAFGAITEGALAIASAMGDAIGWMREHEGVTKSIAIAVGILATAIGAYNIVQGIKGAMEIAQVPTVWALVAAKLALAKATLLAIAPYVAIVAAIAAVIAIIVLCVKHWDKIKEVTKKVWEAIKKAVVNAAKAVKEAISKAWDAVKKATSKVWEGIKKAVSKAWDGIKKGVKTAVKAVKDTVSNVFNAIKKFISKIWNGVKDTTVNVWKAIKAKVKAAIDAVKSTVSNVFGRIKSTISNIWNGVKSTTSKVWGSIKSTVSTVVSRVKNTVSNAFSGMAGRMKSVWNGIKKAITNPIETAKETLSKIVDKIKKIFNFSWSIPKPKIPKFSVSGGKAPWGFGGQGKLPSVSVKWNALGAVVTKPTLVGSVGDTLMGAGEAGAEAILPISVLQDYINRAFDRNVLSYAAAGGNGDVYNVYVNDARINDDAQMREVTKDFLTEIVRLGGMNR